MARLSAHLLCFDPLKHTKKEMQNGHRTKKHKAVFSHRIFFH